MANPNNITLRLASNGGVDRTLSYEEMDNNFKELVTSINDVTSLDGEVTQSQSDISQLQSDVAEKLQVETYNSRVLREDLLNQATLSLDFANNKYAVYEGPVNSLTQMPFNEALDFTRASSATARTATGKIQEVLTDEQRLVGNREGLLIEEQRTNLLKYSEKMDESVYRRLNVDVTPNAVISPNNATEGDKLVADNNDDLHWFYQNVTVVSGTEHTFSIFVKAGAVTEVSIRLQALSGSANTVYLYDLALGTGNGYIESFPNGWYRLSGSFTPDTTSGRFYIFISGAQVAYEGNGASLYIWGAQVEEGSYPSSYIPTVGSSVTREADDCTRTLGDELDHHEFTVYAEIDKYPASGTDARFLSLSDGTGSNRITLREAGNSVIFEGSSASEVIATVGLVGGIRSKIAYSFNNSTRRLIFTVNGVTIFDVTTANFMEPLTVLHLNKGTASPNRIAAVFKDLRLYPTALSEAELITLTGGN